MSMLKNQRSSNLQGSNFKVQAIVKCSNAKAQAIINVQASRLKQSSSFNVKDQAITSLWPSAVRCNAWRNFALFAVKRQPSSFKVQAIVNVQRSKLTQSSMFKYQAAAYLPQPSPQLCVCSCQVNGIPTLLVSHQNFVRLRSVFPISFIVSASNSLPFTIV